MKIFSIEEQIKHYKDVFNQTWALYNGQLVCLD